MSVDETLMCSFQILKVITMFIYTNDMDLTFKSYDYLQIYLMIHSQFSLQPADKKKFPYGGLNSGRPITPPRGANQKKAKK